MDFIKNTDYDFDPTFYKSFHRDLNDLENEQLIVHYNKFGKFEERFISQKDYDDLIACTGVPDFDHVFYREFYDDIKHMNPRQLIKHYIQFGKIEQRFTSQKDYDDLIASSGEPNFDPFFYSRYYNDLNHMNPRHLVKHYINYGKKEGRYCSQKECDDINYIINNYDFDVEFYKNFYKDLNHMNSAKQIIKHFYNVGLEQGRFSSQREIDKLISSVGVPDFDPYFYGKFYVDLKNLTLRELINHYKNFGKSEGRISSKKEYDDLIASTGVPRFDPVFYGSYYKDLSHMDVRNLVKHYNEWGKIEDRFPCEDDYKEVLCEVNKNIYTNFLYINRCKNDEIIINKINDEYFENNFYIDDNLNIIENDFVKTKHGLLNFHKWFREIGNIFDLKMYRKQYEKQYIVYDKKSFYRLYNDFDFIYYKNRYFKDNIALSEDDIILYYHYIGKFQKHIINNKIKIIMYSPPYNILCGGITMMHNLVQKINEQPNSLFYAKLFMHNYLRYDNPFCNDFATIDEITDDTIVIYPEIVTGNPLNAKKVVRWILLNLGIEMPIDHYKNWGTNDLVYFWEFDKNINYSDNIEIYKKLSVPLLHPIFKNINPNTNRNNTCYLLKKYSLAHKKEIEFIHPYDSILIDGRSLNEIKDIFNSCKFLYCYDPNSAYVVFAAICGCIPIIYEIDGMNEEEFFKSRMYNFNNKIYNRGMVYGNNIEKINYIIENKLNENNLEYYKNFYEECAKTYVSKFLDDIECFVNNINNNIPYVNLIFT